MTRVVVAIVALAVMGAGCGSADGDPNLAAAVDQTQAAGSLRFEISGTESDGNENVEVACTGGADYGANRVSLSCDYGPESMEIVGIGATTYVRGGVFGARGLGDKWLKATGGETLGDEFSPQALLAMLRGASQSTERVGEEDVRGIGTVRYRLEVDCGQAEIVDCDGTTAAVDVWVGDDGLVRRIEVTEGSSPFTVEFFDFGADVDIRPPRPGEVESLEGTFGSVTCAAGFGAPIRLEQAIGAFGRHGFTIGEEPACSTESATFENDMAVRAEEGHVYCVVRAHSPAGAPARVQRLGEGLAYGAFRLENVECTLVADDASVEPKLARVDAALSELQR